ncbi:MAG: hypothetical protein ABI167_09195 [Nitrosospira sp.]
MPIREGPLPQTECAIARALLRYWPVINQSSRTPSVNPPGHSSTHGSACARHLAAGLGAIPAGRNAIIHIAYLFAAIGAGIADFSTKHADLITELRTG